MTGISCHTIWITEDLGTGTYCSVTKNWLTRGATYAVLGCRAGGRKAAWGATSDCSSLVGICHQQLDSCRFFVLYLIFVLFFFTLTYFMFVILFVFLFFMWSLGLWMPVCSNLFYFLILILFLFLIQTIKVYSVCQAGNSVYRMQQFSNSTCVLTSLFSVCHLVTSPSFKVESSTFNFLSANSSVKRLTDWALRK